MNKIVVVRNIEIFQRQTAPEKLHQHIESNMSKFLRGSIFFVINIFRRNKKRTDEQKLLLSILSSKNVLQLELSLSENWSVQEKVFPWSAFS